MTDITFDKRHVARPSSSELRMLRHDSDDDAKNKEKLYSFTNELVKLIKQNNEKKNENINKLNSSSGFANSWKACKTRGRHGKACKCEVFRKKASLSMPLKAHTQKFLAEMKRYDPVFKKMHEELKVKVLTLEMEKMNTGSTNEKILESGQMET